MKEGESAYLAVTRKTYQITQVVQIQRCWRLYLDKLTFKHIRNLIHSYEQEDPKTSLLRINRTEATLVDKATGLHVRFRLNGLCFPPTIVYKVYTHRPVVDMGSFSPRNYTGNSENPAKTYVRCENNGWRPVIGTPAEQTGPKVVLRVPDFGGVFFNSLEERRISKLLAVKKRKRAWLKKLYAEGRAAEFDKPLEADNGVEPASPSESELPDLELMRWSAGLDFDEYERDWYSRAISLSELYDQDWHKLGTCLPVYDLPACNMPVVRTPYD
ncbi:unnamed protein product [Calypogeia fissa]